MPSPPFSKKRRKLFPPPTKESLARAALSYLERYAASEASFRRALLNRIRRATLTSPAFAADGAAQEALRAEVEALVLKYRAAGVLNDKAFAEMKASSLRRAGRSARRITEKLKEKGIQNNLIEEALQGVDEEVGEGAEEKAARLFAKKRGFGPFGKRKNTEDTAAGAEAKRARDRRELASLLRAGFGYDVARKVLGASACDDEEVF